MQGSAIEQSGSDNFYVCVSGRLKVYRNNQKHSDQWFIKPKNWIRTGPGLTPIGKVNSGSAYQYVQSAAEEVEPDIKEPVSPSSAAVKARGRSSSMRSIEGDLEETIHEGDEGELRFKVLDFDWCRPNRPFHPLSNALATQSLSHRL